MTAPDQVRRALDLGDIITALTRPLLPPGPPTVDPALGPGEEITQPRPWRPAHNRLTQMRSHLRRARRDRNRYRRHLGQLTAGLDTAESALIDGHGRVWQPVAGGWHRPDLGTLTGEQVHEHLGPARHVLLIDLGGEDNNQPTGLRAVA